MSQEMMSCPFCRSSVPRLRSGEPMSHSIPHTAGALACPGRADGQAVRVGPRDGSIGDQDYRARRKRR